MTIKFQSENQAGVEMLEKNAAELLALIGKTSGEPRGVLALDQIPSAIAVLKTLIGARSGERKRLAIAEIDEKAGEVFEVDISLRAIPLLELLENALRAKKSVTWGIPS